MMNWRKVLFGMFAVAGVSAADRPWLVFEGGDGPGKGKHIVLLSGDEEYRSEESLPMLARMLAEKHGFKCTVLFPIDKETGEINPNEQTNVPGLEVLQGADCVVMAWRFRNLPDEDMKHVVDYVEAGKPVIGLRTSTHAFNIPKGAKYARWSWRNPEWPGGFGKQVLGETWVAHHGGHMSQAARGVVEEKNADHPLLKGVENIFDTADVYTVNELPADARVLFRGQVLAGMTPDAAAVEGGKNDPMMPAGWVRERPLEGGGTQRVVTTTMGSAEGFVMPGLRRFVVNAVFWCTGLEVPDHLDVTPVKPYWPTHFGFGGFQKGKKPHNMAK